MQTLSIVWLQKTDFVNSHQVRGDTYASVWRVEYPIHSLVWHQHFCEHHPQSWRNKLQFEELSIHVTSQNSLASNWCSSEKVWQIWTPTTTTTISKRKYPGAETKPERWEEQTFARRGKKEEAPIAWCCLRIITYCVPRGVAESDQKISRTKNRASHTQAQGWTWRVAALNPFTAMMSLKNDR